MPGTLNAGTASEQAFTGMENLTGNAVVDTFVIDDTFSIGGTIDGLAGADVLDLTDYVANTDTVLSATGATDGFDGTATGITVFANIDNLLGSGATSTLTAANLPDNDNVIDVTGSGKITDAPSGQDIDFDFFTNINGGNNADIFNVTASHVGNLDGGTGADTFDLATGVTLTGNIAGGDGNDDLTFNGTAQVLGTVTGDDNDDTCYLPRKLQHKLGRGSVARWRWGKRYPGPPALHRLPGRQL